MGNVGVVSRLELTTAVLAMTTMLSIGNAFHGPYPCMRKTSLLCSIPRSSRRSAPREGAVLVEWERVSDEGEYTMRRRTNQQQDRQEHKTCQDQDQHIQDIDVVHQAVFCGYKATKEDYRRLRSADPDEPPLEDYSI